MQYLEDLKIDKDNLNLAVIEQPILNMNYHELYCEKLDELNEQKRKVKIEEAELKEKYAELYLLNKKSGEKITEKENESMILVNPDYKAKQKKYYDEVKKQNDIDKEFNILDGVVKSFQQRKNAIEKAIDLFLFGYYGEVKQSKSVDEVKDKIVNKLKKKDKRML
jgi:hypothetical protein